MDVTFPNKDALAIRGIMFDEVPSVGIHMKETLFNQQGGIAIPRIFLELWHEATADRLSGAAKVVQLALTLAGGQNAALEEIEFLDDLDL